MSDHVLDASAIMAHLRGEAGGEVVGRRLALGLLSSVNLAEVVSKLIDKGASATQALAFATDLPCRTTEFDRDLALRAGALRTLTRKHGLSLGDRACLALAQREGLPVLTADRAWAVLDLGVEVVLIR